MISVPVITILNSKGGVGKSTTASHLAAGLSIRGKNVGIVDMDPQGHQSILMGFPPLSRQERREDLYRWIIKNDSLDTVVQPVDVEDVIDIAHYGDKGGNIYLISGDDSSALIPTQMQPNTAMDWLDKLDEFAEIGKLDYIVIDTAPTTSLMDNLTYLAATDFLFVVEPEVLAINGLQQALEKFENVKPGKQKRLNRRTDMLGILPLKVRTSTYLHRSNIEAMAQEYGGKIWTPININVTWGYAAQQGQTVFKYSPGEGPANEAMRYTDRVIAKFEGTKTHA